jgi:hypothetical protein
MNSTAGAGSDAMFVTDKVAAVANSAWHEDLRCDSGLWAPNSRSGDDGNEH